MLPVIYGRRVLRGDDGPDGRLGDMEEFVEIDGLFYDLKWIKSVPGLRQSQLQIAFDATRPPRSVPRPDNRWNAT